MKDDHKDMVMHYQHHHYLHQQQTKRDSCLSDEVDSSGGTATGDGAPKKPRSLLDDNEKALVLVSSGDGATLEVPKRPRGRPPGSKNKPKPPVVITRDADPAAAMRPHILEIPNGHDVVESIARFSRRRNIGICILTGTGAIANVSLRQPSFGPPTASTASTNAAIAFHGRFEILSISATFLPPSLAALSPAPASGVSISLAGPQGQILGGTVTGPLLASGTVVVVAAAFTNPTFHRLPVEDDVSVSVSVSGGGADVTEPQEYRQRHGAATAAEATQDMGVYSGHITADVIWASTARPY